MLWFLGGAQYDMGKSKSLVVVVCLTDEPPKRDSEATSQWGNVKINDGIAIRPMEVWGLTEEATCYG